MATKQRIIDWFKKDWRWLFFAVAGIFLLLHIFFFRGILPYMGDIASNNASVVRDELIPYFDFSSQYLPSGASALTGADEFRVVYSFWTSWVRQNSILPIALILLNTISAYILFYAIYRVVRKFLNDQQIPIIVFVSALSALVIHIILLYSKIAHFYTLIFGFSLFALSSSLVIEQFFFKKNISIKNMLAVSALTLINPAIHYHIIFYVVLALLLFARAGVMAVTKTRPFWKPLWRDIKYIIAVIALSLIPYLIFIHFALPSTDAILEQTPVNYWITYYSSVPLGSLFSLDTFSHLDLYRHGDYLTSAPRYLMVVILAIAACAAFITTKKYTLNQTRRRLIFVLLLLIPLAMWMSLGYKSNHIFSFHELLGSLGALTASCGSFVADAIGRLLNLFINILRFPHRFEFILYYAVAILFALGLWAIFTFLSKRRVKPLVSCGILLLLTLTPILCSADYRDVFLSGDFGSFLKPYTIPADLKNIKTELAKQSNDKLFIMPSFESGRQMPIDGTSYTFIDKYLIYYLNQPTVYNGTNVGTANKVVPFMVYSSILNGRTSWQDILINDLGVTHILVPKKLQSRDKALTYMPGIEQKIASSLSASTRFAKIYEGEDYDLYSTNERAQENQPAVLADYSWASFLQSFDSQNTSSAGRLFFPIQMQKFVNANGSKKIATDNPQRTFYTLMSTDKSRTAYPSSIMLPFTDNLIASSIFNNSAFSLSNLYNKDDPYNYTHEVVPNLLNLPSGQFVGLLKHTDNQITIKFNVAQEGEYTLALRAATKLDSIKGDLDNKKMALNSIDQTRPQDYLDFTNYTTTLHLSQGTHCITFTNQSETLLVESLQAIPQNDIPNDFSKGADNSNFKLEPTDQPGIFSLTLKK